jgi:Mrp family chromosome partitioning ATPase
VLLVDAHLRQPDLAHYVHLGNSEGCSGAYLETWKRLTNGIGQHANDLPTLCVLTPGNLPLANPADLFLSPLAQQFLKDLESAPFDYILFDAAPLLPVADAQILASSMQAAVLVINASRTSRKELQHARRLLNRGHVKVLGAVINKSCWPLARASRYPTAWQSKADNRTRSPAAIAPVSQAAAPNITASPPLAQVTEDE